MCVIGIRHLGGALSRPPAIPNAVGHRDASYSLTVLTPTEKDVAELRHTILEPWRASVVGRFLNFTYAVLTDDESAEAVDAADHRRLSKLRSRYDTNRRLVANHPL